MRYKRKQLFEKEESGEYLLSLSARAGCCDFEPTRADAMDDAHVCTTCVAIDNSSCHLPRVQIATGMESWWWRISQLDHSGTRTRSNGIVISPSLTEQHRDAGWQGF